MEAVFLVVLAVVLLVAGGAATMLIATLMPVSSMERAQQNGRFAGLGADEGRSGGGSGSRARSAQFALAPALRFF